MKAYRYRASHPEWLQTKIHGSSIGSYGNDGALTSSEVVSPRSPRGQLSAVTRRAGLPELDTIGDLAAWRAGTPGSSVWRSSDAIGRYHTYQPSPRTTPRQLRPVTVSSVGMATMPASTLFGNASARAVVEAQRYQDKIIDVHNLGTRSMTNSGRSTMSVGHDLVPVVDSRTRITRRRDLTVRQGVEQTVVTGRGPRRILPSRSFMLPSDGDAGFDGPGCRVADF